MTAAETHSSRVNRSEAHSGQQHRVRECGDLIERNPPLATMSSATGRALATLVNPDEARRREFRARSTRKADAGARA